MTKKYNKLMKEMIVLEYNFGSKIYNDSFNGMNQQIRLYFTFDDGTYDWNKYIEIVNENNLRSIGTKYINNRFVSDKVNYEYQLK